MSSQPVAVPPIQEIEDWFDNPVSQYFFSQVSNLADYIDDGKRDCFAPGEPHKTQDNHSWHLGAEWAFGQLLDMQSDKAIRGPEA